MQATTSVSLITTALAGDKITARNSIARFNAYTGTTKFFKIGIPRRFFNTLLRILLNGPVILATESSIGAKTTVSADGQFLKGRIDTRLPIKRFELIGLIIFYLNHMNRSLLLLQEILYFH